MSENRKAYLRALRLIATDKRAAREAALERAHDIRKFEIELYWKRANYFWLLQAAVFAAVGLIWKDKDSLVPPLVPVALTALGAIAAAASWFSSQGSKFWQENWEHHIDMLEDEFEGHLHKTAYVGRDGIRWSVSGVNDRLNQCFWAFWIFMVAAASVKANPSWSLDGTHFTGFPNFSEVITIACWFFALFGTLYIRGRATDFFGTNVAYPENKIPITDQEVKPYLVSREPKI